MKNLDAFGKELKEPTREAIEAVLNPKLKEKTILGGKFNLDNVYGPDNYVDVGKEIEKDGLKRSTMAEVVSLVYNISTLNYEEINKIKKIIKNRWIWAFTGALYVPNKGVYMQDDPEIKDEEIFMEESDLEKKFRKKDLGVRFVPFGYKIGAMTPKELEKNKYVIALAGKEGAKKLAEIAGTYEHRPYLFALEEVDGPSIVVSTIEITKRLGIGIDNIGDISNNYAFGIKKGNK